MSDIEVVDDAIAEGMCFSCSGGDTTGRSGAFNKVAINRRALNDNSGLQGVNLKRQFEEKYGIKITHRTATRLKNAARKEGQTAVVASYQQLPSLCDELEKNCLGTIAEVEVRCRLGPKFSGRFAFAWALFFGFSFACFLRCELLPVAACYMRICSMSTDRLVHPQHEIHGKTESLGRSVWCFATAAVFVGSSIDSCISLVFTLHSTAAVCGLDFTGGAWFEN